jgi:malonate-semialdehyde dehydrogenase (acetylating) / methylmalonate-semialdehyde dehydrogenase
LPTCSRKSRPSIFALRRVACRLKLLLELAQRDYDQLAELLGREHGKTVPDAKGDIQRGLEVVEFAIGITHPMKDEYTEGRSGHRHLLDPPAARRRHRHHLFNFLAMIPMWKFASAIACGNAFILKPWERDPGMPMKLAELMIEAGLPPDLVNAVNGDKEAVDAFLDDPDIKGGRLRRLLADRAIHL